jgi:putative hemolysin
LGYTGAGYHSGWWKEDEMSQRVTAALLVLLGGMVLGGGPARGAPNPAAVYCEGLGYSYEVKEVDAGQYGVCVFSDTTSCGGWDFLNGECGAEHTRCGKNGGTISVHTGSECPADLMQSTCALCTAADGETCFEYENPDGRCGVGSGPPANEESGCSFAAGAGGRPPGGAQGLVVFVCLIGLARRP